ncbi:MAG: type II toxin-antitoxin system RelE/ParE family toxin [Muribaculaceae bacterium]|nr:type II toxin-antitoxin system RelE/ParE family toxin [Muribaculaceae bacterium]
MELFSIFALLYMNIMDVPIFQFLLLEEARLFLKSIPEQARDKIYYNIKKIQGGIKDSELFKKLENTEIWEFRTLYHGTAYRLFSFWDKSSGAFVIATHGTIKKTQKTPPKEIVRAEEIRKRYFEQKKMNH